MKNIAIGVFLAACFFGGVEWLVNALCTVIGF